MYDVENLHLILLRITKFNVHFLPLVALVVVLEQPSVNYTLIHSYVLYQRKRDYVKKSMSFVITTKIITLVPTLRGSSLTRPPTPWSSPLPSWGSAVHS